MPSARARSSTRKPCAAKTKGTRVTMSRKRGSYSHLRSNQAPRGESGAALVGVIRVRKVSRFLCTT